MNTIKCVACGKFIPNGQMAQGSGAEFFFEPDTHFGPERSEWTCKACVEKEREQAA